MSMYTPVNYVPGLNHACAPMIAPRPAPWGLSEALRTQDSGLRTFSFRGDERRILRRLIDDRRVGGEICAQLCGSNFSQLL